MMLQPNRVQRVIAIVATLMIIGSFVYVPLEYFENRISLGHHIILSIHLGDFDDSNYQYVIDYKLILVQLLGITLATIAALYAAQTRKTHESR